ncbi:hypothetical protein OnM2_018094, partial [Erysiphe neolycopersici]
ITTDSQQYSDDDEAIIFNNDPFLSNTPSVLITPQNYVQESQESEDNNENNFLHISTYPQDLIEKQTPLP